MENEESHSQNHDQNDQSYHEEEQHQAEEEVFEQAEVEQHEAVIENQEHREEHHHQYHGHQQQEQQQDNEEEEEAESPAQLNIVHNQDSAQVEKFQTPQSQVIKEDKLQENGGSYSSGNKVVVVTQRSTFSSGPKNFLQMNRQVKTKQELIKERELKKKQRQGDMSARMSYTSQFGSRTSVIGLEGKQQTLEWGSVSMRNNILDRTPNSNAYKNKSNALSTADNSAKSQANTLGALYSQSKKEKHYHQTNSSAVNFLYSYKTLDGPDKSETDLIPQYLANQEIKQNLNLKSQMDRHNYMRQDEVPEQYHDFQPKKQIIHNLNNNHVQNMRVKNYTSNIF